MDPTVFCVAQTHINIHGLSDYLRHIGAGSWMSDARSDVEMTVEVMGRLCYNSFEPGLNPNVSRVRRTEPYFKNLIASGHGSVLEHGTVSFIFADVTRVFTHELVRHRVGTAISQESLRFVRVTEVDGYIPEVLVPTEYRVVLDRAWREAGRAYQELLILAGVDDLPFDQKKVLTSAARRVLPIGIATSIGWTANVRTIRHCIERRTDPSAEEEIRKVFVVVAEKCVRDFPLLFGDYVRNEHESGIPYYTTPYPKV